MQVQFSANPPAPALPNQSALTLYKIYEKSGEKLYENFRKQPDIVRQVERFLSDLKSIKTPEDLLKNFRALNFVLTAFGLEEAQNQLGLLRKVLTQRLDDPQNVAKRMNDTRFRVLAETLRMGEEGLAKLKSASVLGDVVSKFQRNRFEINLGEQNPAVREALYFKRNAPNVTAPLQLLGDRILRKVTTTALGMPQQLAFQGISTQARAIGDRLDVSKLSDKAFMDKFVQRFLIRADQALSGTGQPLNQSIANMVANNSGNGGSGFISLLA